MADRRNLKTRQRQTRQDELRLLLSNQKHLEHVIATLDKLGDETKEIDKEQVERYKIYIAGKFKIIDKYLPNLSNIEWNGVVDTNINHTIGEKEAKAIKLALENNY